MRATTDAPALSEAERESEQRRSVAVYVRAVDGGYVAVCTDAEIGAVIDEIGPLSAEEVETLIAMLEVQARAAGVPCHVVTDPGEPAGSA